jgi:signal transduction histidine kinase
MIKQRHSPLALRIAIVFSMLAGLAVVIVMGLVIVFGGRDVDKLVADRRADLVQSLRASAAGAYDTGVPGWSDVDLRPALNFAAALGTEVAVMDRNGHLVASTIKSASAASRASQIPIALDGRQIGTLLVNYTGNGLDDSATKLRSSLIKAVVGSAVLTVALASAVAALVAPRVTHPIERLIGATRAMSKGDRQARVGQIGAAPREFKELAIAFDGMAAALMEQGRLRSDLLAEMAHELRTPVAILQASCEALLDGIVPHTAEQTQSLHEEVLRLARLVDDLQSLAAADTAALQLSSVPCDLAVVVDAAFDAMTPRLNAANLTVTRHLEVAQIDGDPVRLHQVIINVLTNAQKFTPSGGRIVVELTARDGDAWLKISDTGIGITPEDRVHLFERFWRGSNVGQVTGSGLGLAVVARLVEAHGGNVAVQSETGSGTTVLLRFPLAPRRPVADPSSMPSPYSVHPRSDCPGQSPDNEPSPH